MNFIATLADLCERIPVLWNENTDQFGSNTGILLNILNTDHDIVKSALSPYYGDDLKLAAPRYTIPIKLSQTENFEASWGINLSKVTSYTGNSNVTDTEHIIITATSITAFTVKGYLSGELGTGDKNSDFTATGNLFKILSADWSDGDFVVGDKFIFSRTWYEPILTLLTSYLSAHQVLMGRYVSEGANDLDFENNSFLKEYTNLKNLLISPNSPEHLTAPNAEYTVPNFEEDLDWMAGYDIDNYGLNSNGY